MFTCIAALGRKGCGFEHQFAAITRALGADGKAPPAENQGFLRPDAYLAMVMITNEDDCSAHRRREPAVRHQSEQELRGPLGPRTNFRCNEFGHICDGAPPGRRAPSNDVSADEDLQRAACRRTTDGFLLTVDDTATRLKALKADPRTKSWSPQSRAGDAVHREWKAPSTQDTSCGAASCPWPVIAHACTAPNLSFANPAVRVGELAGKFGATGLVTSTICEDDFSPALFSVANEIVAYVNEPCIMGHIAKRAGTTRDDCTVTDNATGDAISSCDETGGAAPCWQLAASTTTTCGGASVKVTAAGAAAAPLDTTVECAMCKAGVSDPTLGCP